MHPNLFQFATSELSQDAFLCWLLAWADPTNATVNPALHRVGVGFLKSIYAAKRRDPPAEFSKVEIDKQRDHIDILCTINRDTAIVIEDKVGTQEHDGQTKRYHDLVSQRGFTGEKLICVYIQTGDQSNYSSVLGDEYTVLKRSDLLNVLETEDGKEASKHSDILADFTSHLRQIENEVKSYATCPLDKWSWNSWKGFYTRLQVELNEGEWGYVANPAGGFLGFWWHWQKGDEVCQAYLQLEHQQEQDALCFKICVTDESKRKEARDLWYHKILAEGDKHGLKTKRPDRFGNGKFMTVAVLDRDYRIADSQHLLDLTQTCSVMRKAECLLDACAPGFTS